jgi:hypothetical protein
MAPLIFMEVLAELIHKNDKLMAMPKAPARESVQAQAGQNKKFCSECGNK